LVPLLQHASLPAIVNALHGDDDVLVLEPAVGGEGFDGGGYDFCGIFEAGCQGPAVDEVELLGEDPGVFGVVDLEGAVWGDTLSGLLCQYLGKGEGNEDEEDYLFGWMGLRSVPITWAEGWRSAKIRYQTTGLQSGEAL
jgi:hypothetical protein